MTCSAGTAHSLQRGSSSNDGHRLGSRLWYASHCSLTGGSIESDRRRRKTKVIAAIVTTIAPAATHHTFLIPLTIGGTATVEQRLSSHTIDGKLMAFWPRGGSQCEVVV